MVSCRLSLVLGILVTFFTLALLDPILTSSEVRYLECRQKAHEGRIEYEACIAKELSDEVLNETRAINDDEKCKNCKHFCRKQNEIIHCARKVGNFTVTLSNKASYMVPFLRDVFEETIAALCENDEEILKALADTENTPCMDRHWEPCDSLLMVSGYFNKVFFCDSTDPANSTFTPQYVCQKMHTALECLRLNSIHCLESLKKSITLLLSKLRSSASCSKYY
ncbi:uncharacterized protein LOC124174118 [Ischnura elegans]|uniref:uncharacterized protein LOC124174118 n=1 Tax=Ischnura elegans TaxID=197161 RepID=UPI001ED87CBE|nr:uncharacterized protein LOC124174118 [Ischnura elegans]